MTQVISPSSLTRLKRYLPDYRPQLEKALTLTAIQALESPDADEEAFSQALADLHVCATVLESYSEGMVDAIHSSPRTRLALGSIEQLAPYLV